jgi:3-oxoacyl-[acyl-carrier-protein] synthase II
MDEKKRVVITGMGLVSCFGTQLEEFYQKLLEGESGIKLITEFNTERLLTKFGASVKNFNPEDFVDKKLARRADPCINFAMAAGKMAVAHAKLNLNEVDKARAGVLVGSGMGGMQRFYDGSVAFEMAEKELDTRRVSPFFIPFIITNMSGALLAIELGFKGPNYSISTACATSNYSIFAALNHIRNGHADVMLAGGTEAGVNSISVAGFSALRALSRNNENCEAASKPWDKNRDGFVLGEGCGIFVLESLEHALKRGAPILAELKGGAITCDAHHMTEPTPDGSDVAMCIEMALKDAGMKAEEINYVNAHATATPVGDLCEVRALKKVFGPHLENMRVNATKSMIAHALGAAGALELIATVMAIQTGKVHPTINLTDPEEELAGINVVRDKAEEFSVNAAISNSFGFGGHNSVIVVSKYEQ